MPRVNRRLVRTVYWAGICWHVAYWHVAYFDRTVHVYRALIGRPTDMRNLKKKVTHWAGICWHVACWHVSDFDRTVYVYRARTCHVEMINCETVRLPRQICNFCVSAVSCMESRFLESAFFFICLSSVHPNGSGGGVDRICGNSI
jgi:hypothetical protein